MNKFLIYVRRILLLILVGLITYFIIFTLVEELSTSIITDTKFDVLESSHEDINN